MGWNCALKMSRRAQRSPHCAASPDMFWQIASQVNRHPWLAHSALTNLKRTANALAVLRISSAGTPCNVTEQPGSGRAGAGFICRGPLVTSVAPWTSLAMVVPDSLRSDSVFLCQKWMGNLSDVSATHTDTHISNGGICTQSASGTDSGSNPHCHGDQKQDTWRSHAP